MKKIYVTKVEIDEETKALTLAYPNHFDMATELNLKDGELLVWEVEDEIITIKKKV